MASLPRLASTAFRCSTRTSLGNKIGNVGFSGGRGLSSSAKTSFGSKVESALTSKTSLSLFTLLSAGSISLYTFQYGIPGLTTARAMTDAEHGLHSPEHPWPQNGLFETFDHSSIRRGYQVYREVCSACHSLDRVAWRNLVGVSHTVDEVKAMAEEVEYTDGPNDTGDMFERPGKLSDYMPKPYANEEAARAGNAGALPPDLSLMTKARHGGADYVFSLLTGYVDPPAGLEIKEGMNYNPYFPGGAIGMARVLYDGLVEYPDETPATTTQMAKDVVQFLTWAAEPELDERKRMGLQATIMFSALFVISIWVKRYKWLPVKTRKLVYNPPKSH